MSLDIVPCNADEIGHLPARRPMTRIIVACCIVLAGCSTNMPDPYVAQQNAPRASAAQWDARIT